MKKQDLDPAAAQRVDDLVLEELFSPAELYHESSKLYPSDTLAFKTIAMVNSSPEIQRIIARPRAQFLGYPAIELPRMPLPAPRSLEAILQKRRSVRQFSGASIALQTLANLLHLGDGITGDLPAEEGVFWKVRTAPSPGGLFPIDLYCFALRVEELSPGLYSYDASGHRLEQIVERDFARELGEATYLSEAAGSAAVCFALSAVFPRAAFKYGERSYRFALLEAGHIAQNLLLAAVAEGLGAVPVGGFYDEAVNGLLQLDGCEEAVVYLVLVGRLP